MPSLFSHHTSDLELPLGVIVDLRDPVVSVGRLRGCLDLREELLDVSFAVHMRQDIGIMWSRIAHNKVRQWLDFRQVAIMLPLRRPQ